MTIRLGGMALRDGVLLQSERYWAAAVRRPSGEISVSSGASVRLPGRERLGQIPVVRGLARLGEALAVLPAVRHATGSPVLPQEDPRLLAATGASAAASVALRTVRGGSPLLKEIAAAGLAFAPVLIMLRNSRLMRYHGAEHKSIAAYEDGGVAAAAAAREHDRCGSNLIAPLMLTSVGGSLLLRAVGRERQPLATLLLGIVSLGTAMELFLWMSRHQDHPLARALRRPGLELQRLFTTAEPSDEQLEVAHVALQELLRLEEAAPAAASAAGA